MTYHSEAAAEKGIRVSRRTFDGYFLRLIRVTAAPGRAGPGIPSRRAHNTQPGTVWAWTANFEGGATVELVLPTLNRRGAGTCGLTRISESESHSGLPGNRTRT